RDGDHLGALRRVPRRRHGDRPRRHRRGLWGTPERLWFTAADLPLHPRVPRRPRPLLHRDLPRGPRRGGGAVGRGEGGRLGGRNRGGRHDHAPPRGWPRPPPVVRPPAPGSVRGGSARREARGGPGGRTEPRGPPGPLTL